MSPARLETIRKLAREAAEQIIRDLIQEIGPERFLEIIGEGDSR
jgi:hypothetical protein